MVWKRGKHQKSKQRYQDLGWKVHDRAKSFVLPPYTMHELLKQQVSIGLFLNTEQTTIVFFACSRPKKRTKTYNKELCRVS